MDIPSGPRAHRWWTPTPPAFAIGVVRREMTLLAIGAELVWIAESPLLWPTRLPAAAAVAVTCLLASAAVLLIVQLYGPTASRRWLRYVNVTALVAVAVSVRATTSLTEEVASLAVLVAIVAGAMLAPAEAGVTLGVLVVLWFGPVARVVDPAAPAAAQYPVLVSAYVAVVGGGLLLVRVALERRARLIDAQVRERLSLESEIDVAAGVRDGLLRQERLLHERVLNTLTAIERGGLSTDPVTTRLLRTRCEEAAGVLGELRAGMAPAPMLDLNDRSASGLFGFVQAMRAEGFTVSVNADDVSVLPEQVREALAVAIREALANAARHSRASTVQVRVRVSDSPHRAVTAIVTDDGVGFDRTDPGRSFGLDEAIDGAMRSVRGTASVRSRPGEGTTVELYWSTRPDADREPAALSLPPLAMAAWFVALTAVLAWGQFGHPPLTAAAAVLLGVCILLVVLFAQEAPLGWLAVVLVSTLGPLLMVAQASTGAEFPGGWVMAAAASLMASVAAISPPWGWVILAASSLSIAATTSTGIPLLEPDTVAVLLGASFGWALRRDSARMVSVFAARERAEAQLDGVRATVGRLRVRYALLSESQAGPLLESIATGAARPADPQVRARAGVEEAFVRILMRVDPDGDPVRAAAVALARTAREHQVVLDVDVLTSDASDVTVPDSIVGTLTCALEASVPGSTARLSAWPDGDAAVLTLVTVVPAARQPAMECLEVPCFVDGQTATGDVRLVWEALLHPAPGPAAVAARQEER